MVAIKTVKILSLVLPLKALGISPDEGFFLGMGPFFSWRSRRTAAVLSSAFSEWTSVTDRYLAL